MNKLKVFFKKVEAFFSALFSDNPSVSSKRVFGSIGFLAGLVLMFLVKLTNLQFNPNDVSIIKTLFFISGVLIGGGSLIDLWINKKGKK